MHSSTTLQSAQLRTVHAEIVLLFRIESATAPPHPWDHKVAQTYPSHPRLILHIFLSETQHIPYLNTGSHVQRGALRAAPPLLRLPRLPRELCPQVLARDSEGP